MFSVVPAIDSTGHFTCVHRFTCVVAFVLSAFVYQTVSMAVCKSTIFKYIEGVPVHYDCFLKTSTCLMSVLPVLIKN